jgi:hypothetical protein
MSLAFLSAGRDSWEDQKKRSLDASMEASSAGGSDQLAAAGEERKGVAE